MKRLVIPLLLCGLVPSLAQACHDLYPKLDDIEQYSAVFVGRVTGIQLDGYEHRLLFEPEEGPAKKVYENPEDELDEPIWVTNGASSVSVFVVPTLVVAGAPAKNLRLRLVGCTYNLPELKEAGLFFVHQGHESAITLWQKARAEDFREAIKALSVDLKKEKQPYDGGPLAD